jgi:hypothetical protein
MPTAQELIATAIQNKMIVCATYQGFQPLMCPHVIGYKGHARGPLLNALFFRFAGGSKSGLPPGGMWRCVKCIIID